MTKSQRGSRAIISFALAIVFFVAFAMVGDPANASTKSAVITVGLVRGVIDILFFVFLVAAIYNTARWFRASE